MASKSMSAAVQVPIAILPEGFQRIGSVANAGWFNMKKVGNILHGVLEGMFERNDTLSPTGKSKFFQIKLIEDCEVRTGNGEDTALATAHAGDYANLNHGPKTKELESLLADVRRGAVYQVYGVVAGEKIKLKNGKTMHNFDVGTNMVKPPKATEDVAPDFDGSPDDQAE